jgi:PAS domain S-box-containing protein
METIVKNHGKSALKVLRSGLLKAIENGNSIIIVTNAEGTIEFASEFIDKILHYKPSELIGKNLVEITDSDSIPMLKQIFDDVSVSDYVKIDSYTMFCSYCNRHFFDGIATTYGNKDVRKFIFYLHDVTERISAEENLKQVNIELDSFIYKASHDLRAPLLSILGLINVAEKTPDDAMTYLSYMKKSVTRLDSFITQLASYTRNKNTQLKYGKVSLQETVDEILETYQFIKNIERLRVEVINHSKVEVYTDEFRFKILLNNLISNAIKYQDTNKANSFLKITLDATRENFIIKLEDNGIGLSEENRTRIFGMFERFTDQAEGSGLGLFIVKKAIEKMNARINVSSILGQGTTFEIIGVNHWENCVEMVYHPTG